MQDVEIDKNLSYKEYPISILDFSERKTRTKTIKMVKVQWSHHSTEEITWEVEDKMRMEYPHLFKQKYRFRRIFSLGRVSTFLVLVEGN